MEVPVVPPERNLYGHPLPGFLWERQFEKVPLEHGWEKVPHSYGKDNSRNFYGNTFWKIFPNWECLFVNKEQGLLVRGGGRHKISWKKKQNIEPMWKVLMKQVDLGASTSFWNMFIWSALNGNAKQAKISSTITKICSYLNFRRGNRKITWLTET